MILDYNGSYPSGVNRIPWFKGKKGIQHPITSSPILVIHLHSALSSPTDIKEYPLDGCYKTLKTTREK